jgi:CRP-like cAMP-binding protein
MQPLSDDMKEKLQTTLPWADELLVDWLIKNAHLVRKDEGDFLFRELSPVDGLFIIVKGRVKTCKNCRRKNERIIGLYKEGEVVGLRSVLHHKLFQKSAIAIEETTVLHVSKHDYFQGIMDHPIINLSFLKSLEADITELEERATVIIQKPTRERLIRALIMLYSKFGVDEDSTIRLNFSPREMASLICTTRTTVYRILSSLEKDGLIDVDHNKIRVLQPTELLEAS